MRFSFSYSFIKLKQKIIYEQFQNSNMSKKQMTATSWIQESALPDELQLTDDTFTQIWNMKPGKRQKIKMFGKEVEFPREQQVYGVENYTYSGVTFSTQEIPPLLQSYIDWANETDNDVHKYNMILINWYINGSDYIGYHKDDEKMIIANTSVMTISFGVERKMKIKDNNKKHIMDIPMINNHYMIMGGTFQNEFYHSIPKTKKQGKRISITLRKFCK
jgi:alkylated DNA repair dioxygenase AlkB